MKNYTHSQGVEYTPETDNISYQCISVLEFLKGKRWDDVALAFVHSLRPSAIRVIDKSVDGLTCDSKIWRVTIYLDDDGFIKKTEQEVEVWLPDGVEHGQALKSALLHGINSKQCKWWIGAGATMYDGIVTHKLYKYDKDGNAVPFPCDSPICCKGKQKS